jgi:hypothetical protein
MSTDLAVRAVKLRRTFGSFVAVNDVDLEVPRGSIYGFLGPNGAGKTSAACSPPAPGRPRWTGWTWSRTPRPSRAASGT